MMAQVTIPGLSGPAVTVTGSAGGDVLTLAQLVANALILADTSRGGQGVAGTITSITASIASPPTVAAGGVTELVVRDTVSGAFTVPSGPSYNYVVVDDPLATTITGGNGAFVTNNLSTSSTGTFNLTGNVT